MKKDKTVLGVTFSKLIGFLIFLMFLWLLNYLNWFTTITDFLNQNIEFIIIMSVLFYLAELFEIFIFPFNIPYPLFNAFGGVLLVRFLFMLFTKLNIYGLTYIEPYIQTLVFIIVIIVGYVKIVMNFIPKKEKKEEPISKKKNPKWEDVGKEFKMALYNLASCIKEELDPNKKKK